MLSNGIIIALIILFIHGCTWTDMIFDRPASWLRMRLPEWITKMLFDCPACMSPYYGTLIIYIADRYKVGDFSFQPVPVILTVLVAGGVNIFSIMAIRRFELNTRMMDELDDIKKEGE